MNLAYTIYVGPINKSSEGDRVFAQDKLNT